MRILTWSLFLLLCGLRLLELGVQRGNEARFCVAAGRGPLKVRGEGSVFPKPHFSKVKWVKQSQVLDLAGEIAFSSHSPQLPFALTKGSYEVVGNFRCAEEFRNPSGELFAPFLLYEKKKTIASVITYERLAAPSIFNQLSSTFEEFLNKQLADRKAAKSLVRAVWLGDLSGFSDDIVEGYRNAGLLPLLALSGQHVTALVFLLGILVLPFRGISYFFPRRMFLNRDALLLFSASLLWMTSGNAPSMYRTLVMAIAVILVRRFLWKAPPIQILASSVAFAILCDPGLVGSPGFILSIVGVLFLDCLRLSSWKQAIRRYLLLSLCLPLFLAPWTSFFFSQISPLAPFAAILLGWTWDLLLIPLGFSLPFLALFLPGAWQTGIDNAVAQFFKFNEIWLRHVEPTPFLVISPNFLEISLITLCIFCGARWALDAVEKNLWK